MRGEQAAGGAALVAAWDFANVENGAAMSATGVEFDIALNSVGTAAVPRSTDGSRMAAAAVFFNGETNVEISEESVLSALAGGEQFTLEAWVYPMGGSSSGELFSKGGEFVMSVSPLGELSYSLANTNPGWGQVNTGITIPQDTWTHLALGYDGPGGDLSLYIDGE